MIKQTHAKRRTKRLSVLIGSGALVFGLLSSCDEKFVTLMSEFDLCGTVLANCNPGDFLVRSAHVGDYCVDPACTVPGACDNVPLGTITEVCP